MSYWRNFNRWLHPKFKVIEMRTFGVVSDENIVKMTAFLFEWSPVHRAMMTSSNGNIIRVTGPLCGEFIGHRGIPLTKANDAELWCLLLICAWINALVNNREAGDLRRHRAHYDVRIICTYLCPQLCTAVWCSGWWAIWSAWTDWRPASAWSLLPSAPPCWSASLWQVDVYREDWNVS